jgi:hypothetical protein
MDTETYNKNLHNLVIYYLEANGLQEKDYRNKFSLYNDGGISYIKDWNLELPRPIKEQLEILDMNEVNGKQDRKRKLKNILTLQSLNNNEIDRLRPKLKHGDIFINSDTNRLNFISNNIVFEI